MSHDWPELSTQGVLGVDWWVKSPKPTLRPGLLVWAMLPHVDVMPHRLRVEGRQDAKVHERFEAVIEPLSVRAENVHRQLPVAALPEFSGETYVVQRAKRRPALVLSGVSHEVPKSLKQGAAGWLTSPTMLVAPYYGVDQGGSRGGWNPAFVTRIQQLEWPQFFWDRLPIGGASASILRIDQVQPIGTHQNAFEPTGFELAPEALRFLRDLLEWFLSATPTPPSSEVADTRALLMEESRRG